LRRKKVQDQLRQGQHPQLLLPLSGCSVVHGYSSAGCELEAVGGMGMEPSVRGTSCALSCVERIDDERLLGAR